MDAFAGPFPRLSCLLVDVTIEPINQRPEPGISLDVVEEEGLNQALSILLLVLELVEPFDLSFEEGFLIGVPCFF
ncbi:hypothetical protein PG985_000113 [Apiospora marii]|uniref:uncharacterized protein n=1 Tax=Apiospora marii TaxID=335849 RepID=UPI0031320818